MKIKSVITVMLLTVGILTFSTGPSAMAGECSVEDPCQTYAMVDDAGVVTNTIVCQPSVCGSGSFAGSRVVPQVAANATTGENQGGYLGDPEAGKVVTESNGRFYVNNDQVVKNDQEISATFSSSVSSFTYEDTLNLENTVTIPMKEEVPALNTSVTISAVETGTVETLHFNKRETVETVSYTIESYKYQILERRFARIQKLLGMWWI